MPLQKVNLKTFRLIKGLARINTIYKQKTIIVRFLDNEGRNTNIVTGQKQKKGTLIFYQTFLWNVLTEGQAKKLAKRNNLRCFCQ